MPTLYYYDSLRIEMRPRKAGHNIPHVHAMYHGHEVAIDFDGNIIVGRIERQKQDIAQTWVLKNKEMLIRKWKEMRGHV